MLFWPSQQSPFSPHDRGGAVRSAGTAKVKATRVTNARHEAKVRCLAKVDVLAMLKTVVFVKSYLIQKVARWRVVGWSVEGMGWVEP